MRLQRRYQNSAMVAAGLAFIAIASSPLAVDAQMAPEKGASPSEQPTKPWPTLVRGLVCTATGTWTDAYGSGPGSFTRTPNPACHPHGVWTDAYGYTWRFKANGNGQVAGKVNYHGIPACTYQVWPVTGTYQGKNFEVTATNPASTDHCSSFFSYSLTIQ